MKKTANPTAYCVRGRRGNGRCGAPQRWTMTSTELPRNDRSKNNDDDDAVQVFHRICAAAERGDAGRAEVLALLKCRATSQLGGLDTPLSVLPSSSPAAALLARLSSPNADINLPPPSLLRALLMLPCIYETPWKATVAAVQALHRLDPNTRKKSSSQELWNTVAEIQSFLQQAVAAWWKKEAQKRSANKSTPLLTQQPSNPPGAAAADCTTPRKWFQTLAETALLPLWKNPSDNNSEQNDLKKNNNTCSRDDRNWMLPLELVSTILSLCQDLDLSADSPAGAGPDSQTPRSLNDHVLDCIFVSNRRVKTKKKPDTASAAVALAGSVRPDRFLAWLTLASDVRVHLRPSDHYCLQKSLRQSLADLPPTDLPGAARFVASFAVGSFMESKNSQFSIHRAVSTADSDKQTWLLVLLQLLQTAAAQDAATYSTTETVLQSSFHALATPLLYEWNETLHLIHSKTTATTNTSTTKRNATTPPLWVLANLHLLLFQSIQKSGSTLVSSLVAHAMGKTSATSRCSGDLTAQCWHSLVQLALSSFHTTSSFATAKPPKKRAKVKPAEESVQRACTLLEGVGYKGAGRFVYCETNQPAPFSTTIVCQSIHLGQTEDASSNHQHQRKRADQFYASERAQLWVQASRAILESGTAAPRTMDTLDFVLAAIIVVTLYHETPTSRATLVRALLQSLISLTGISNEWLQSLHVSIVSVLVSSQVEYAQATGDDSGLLALYPLADALSSMTAPPQIISMLATALAPLPPARRALWMTIPKYLKTTFLVDVTGVAATMHRAARQQWDSLLAALRGLCTLLTAMPHQSDCEKDDETAMDAWNLLFSILVLDKPALPLSARRWWYDCIITFVQESRFAPDTVRRLLGATLLRVLQYYESSPDGALVFLPSKVFSQIGSMKRSRMLQEERKQAILKEDLDGLLQLVLVLLNHSAQESEERTRVLGRCHEKMTSLLSVYRDGSNTALQMQPLDSFDWIDENENDMLFCFHTASVCLMALLRYVVMDRTGLRHTNIMGNDADVRERLVSRLKAMESSVEYEDDVRFGTLGTGHGEMDMDDPEANKLLCSLCDVFLCALVDRQWRLTFNVDESTVEMVQIALSASSVMALKLKFHNVTLQRAEGGLPPSSLDESTIVRTPPISLKTLGNTTASLLRLSQEALRYTLQENLLHDTDHVLRLALAYCRALNGWTWNSSDRNEVQYYEIAEALSNLYRSFGSEEPSKVLIDLLEENFISEGEDTDEGGQNKMSPFLQQSIESPDEIDEVIQAVRKTILSALQRCLNNLSSTVVADGDDLILPRKRSSSDDTPAVLNVKFWISNLSLFAKDIREGVNGDSGGIPTNLYMLYVKSIECCCSVLSGMLDKAVPTEPRIIVAVKDSAKMIREIMCLFPITTLAHFKETLMIAAHFLPSLLRKAARNFLMRGNDDYTSRIWDKADDQFSCAVLGQAIEIQLRWHQIGLNSKIAWAEVAGLEHVKSKQDEQSSSASQTSDPNALGNDSNAKMVPSVVVVPASIVDEKTSAELKARDSPDHPKLQLHSKQSLFSALLCSLISMEHNWTESYQILQQHQPSGMKAVPEPSLDDLKRYTSFRSQGLARLMRSLLPVFDEIESGNASTPGRNSKTVVMTFPDTAKSRVVRLLDRITTVMQVALRRIIFHLETHDVSGLFVVAEALSCLSSWVILDSDSLDYIGRCRRLYNAESTKELREVVYSREDPILSKLPKLLVRLEELEMQLQKLHHLLGKLERSSTHDKEGIRQADALIGSCVVHDSGSARSTSLREAIAAKVKQSASQELFGMAIIESSLIEESGDERNTRKRRRKALEIDRRIRKERRRPILRSRNQLVDKWLHLDQEYSRDGEGDDAFVDLEDFLVDG